MALYISSLNSGSNANCYYIGNEQEAVLVDAGLSCRETERRMRELELPMEKVKALFISHEHGDHITGVAGIAKKYRLPVYITTGTLQSSGIPVEPSLLRSFRHNLPVRIGALSVLPFRKSHDARDPHSFIVKAGELQVGVITDIGYACKQVLNHFSRCDAAFLESNYCETLLANGNYPFHLKKRISSDEGHLSNRQALELFMHHRSPGLQLLVLSHLSKNNNRPDIVEALFAPHAGNTRIVVAGRYAPTPVFCIERTTAAVKPARTEKKDRQLSLF